VLPPSSQHLAYFAAATKPLLQLAAGDLASAHAQATALSEAAAAGEALRNELEQELLDTQTQLQALTTRLSDSNTVSIASEQPLLQDDMTDCPMSLLLAPLTGDVFVTSNY